MKKFVITDCDVSLYYYDTLNDNQEHNKTALLLKYGFTRLLSHIFSLNINHSHRDDFPRRDGDFKQYFWKLTCHIDS